MLKTDIRRKTKAGQKVRRPKPVAIPIVEPVAPEPVQSDVSLAAQEISDKAIAELKELQQRADTIQAELTQNSEKLTALREAIIGRNNHIAMLKQTLERAESAHRASVDYAGIELFRAAASPKRCGSG